MDWKDIMRKAREQGWRIEQTSRTTGHLKWFAPDGKTVVVSSSTPSDHRAIRNHISLLRRGGFIL